MKACATKARAIRGARRARIERMIWANTAALRCEQLQPRLAGLLRLRR
jgi:hypothetical protein